MPRHRIDPIFDRLAIEFGDRINIAHLNLATADRIAVKYGIRAVPTLLIFSQGKVIYRTIGTSPETEIVRHLNAQLLNAQFSIDTSRSAIFKRDRAVPRTHANLNGSLSPTTA